MSILKGQLAELSKNAIKKVFNDKGYAFFENGKLNLNIIGIRNISGRADVFDDNILVLYQDDSGWVVHSYEATTEPGSNILKKPIVKGGTAILIPGQYNSVYRIDIHGGKRKYTALCQRNGKVKIWRDDNRDRKPDYSGQIHEGMFGINIHRQWGSDEREYTGGVSAGCQVFRSSKDFYEFMDVCNKAADKWGNSFTYTLINSSDVKI